MNSMKRQKDKTLKDERPRSVGAQYATGDEWRNMPCISISGNPEKGGQGRQGRQGAMHSFIGEAAVELPIVGLIIK